MTTSFQASQFCHLYSFWVLCCINLIRGPGPRACSRLQEWKNSHCPVPDHRVIALQDCCQYSLADRECSLSRSLRTFTSVDVKFLEVLPPPHSVIFSPLCSVSMLNHTYWFSNVKSALNLWIWMDLCEFEARQSQPGLGISSRTARAELLSHKEILFWETKQQ